MSVPFQTLLAQTAEGGAAGLANMVLPLVLVLGIMYFLMIRPQQKQAREHKTMLDSLKKGDEVITTGGLLGRIYAVADRYLTLEVAKDVRVQVLKSAVQARAAQEGAEKSAAESKDKKDEAR